MLLIGLPTHGRAEALMLLPGQLGVSPHGTMTYSIPIAVPPGTAGMVPALTLDYASDGGNGLVGLGWSLGGLPSIGRCPKTYVLDGERGSVNFDANDRFCLDGLRLILVGGTYGAAGSEYRTEIEGFSQILAYGAAGTGPAWFKVRTKSGQILEFGNTTDSRPLAAGSSTARSWGVNKISDTKGNYLTVEYVNDTTNGQVYPKYINYTGHEGSSPVFGPYNRVELGYQSRTDAAPSYHAGTMSMTTVRLKDIWTQRNSGPAYENIRHYVLAYQEDPVGPSKLTSVRLCDGSTIIDNAHCLPATTFTWSGGAATFSLLADWNLGGYNIIPADWAGTGRAGIFLQPRYSGWTSFLYTADPSGTFNYSGWGQLGWDAGPDSYGVPANTVCLADWDGDGKVDVARVNASGAAYWRNVSVAGAWLSQIGSTSSNLLPCHNGYNTLESVPADFTGDGRSDLIKVWSTALPVSGSVCTINYSVGNGDGTFQTPQSTNFGASCGFQVGDFDGDGKADFYALNTMYFSNGTGFTSHGSGPWPGKLVFAGDFNGDGKTDPFVFPTSGSGPGTLYLSKGDGTLASAGWTAPSSWSLDNFNLYAHFGDFNGDGRTDILYGASGEAPAIYLSTGTGFVTMGSLLWPTGLPALTFDYLAIADFNGDGVSDIQVARTTNGASTPQYVSTLTPTVITQVTTGLGAVATVTYKKLADPSVYTKYNDAIYPNIDVQGAGYVVSQLDAPDGAGGSYTTTYTYEGAKTSLDGRGYLGFRKQIVTDTETETTTEPKIVQTTTFRQDYPYIGLVDTQTKVKGSVTLNTTTNWYVSKVFPGRFFPYLAQSTEVSKDLNGADMPAVTTTSQYDNWGNVTQIAVTTSNGGGTKTTDNTYEDPDTTNWILGRLKKATVTSTVP